MSIREFFRRLWFEIKMAFELKDEFNNVSRLDFICLFQAYLGVILITLDAMDLIKFVNYF